MVAQWMNPASFRRSWRLLICLGLSCASGWAQAVSTGATFGEVVNLGTTPSDIVVDETRGRLYLVNSNANRIDLYDYRLKQLRGSIPVGAFPLAAAISPDGAFLYVTNTAASSLAVIDLNTDRVLEYVSLPARPEGVAVGNDGRVLITTQGAGLNNALNTLILFDPRQESFNRISFPPFPPPLSTPNPLPAVFVGRPATAFPGRLSPTADGNFIVGMVAINQTLTSAATTLFVYEVASGTILRNRLVTGQSTVLAISPEGGRFMAGSTQYDTATLAVNAQMNVANLPFFLNDNTSIAFNLQANFGGSVFSPDGQTLYSAFNNAPTNERPRANVLLISNPRNLSTSLGIRLPESILGRMVMSSDGADIWALSESGILHLPVSRLYERPILMPESTQVFLAIDECNRGVARARVRIANAGGGRLTFAVPNTGAALVAQVTTGVAPSTITFTMEPGRAGVVRQAGTNLYTGTASNSGAPVNVVLASNEAINLPNVIRVYMNFRQPDQRGLVYPVPTSLVTAEGLYDMVLDEPRNRLYITNSGYNRIEVFDTQRLRFLEPIETGQLPHQMAMSLDGTTLYVGNTGGESIQMIDLDTLQVTGSVVFPPIPRAGNQAALQPVALAMSISGLQFIMANGTFLGSTGSFWRLVGNTAVPRVSVNNFPPATVNGPHYMAATPGGERVLVLTTNNNGTAWLYDGLADAFTNSRQVYNQAPVSYFGPLAAAVGGAYYLAGGQILSPALTPVGGAERPGVTQIGPPPGPGQPPTQTVVSAGQRNVAAVFPLSETSFLRVTTPVRQAITAATRDDPRTTLELVDSRTGAEQVAAFLPENPVISVFGNARVNVPSRQMLVDSRGTAYLISLSGLVVVPLTRVSSATQPALPLGARAIVNATDGSANYRPGSFVAVNGVNLAAGAAADQLPLPTVLGGSCVVFNDVPLPLIETGPTRILAQIPAEVRPGANVVQVRSLATAQQSPPVVVNVQRP